MRRTQSSSRRLEREVSRIAPSRGHGTVPTSSRDALTTVRDAVRTMPPSGRYGRRNVFISEIWDRVGDRIGMSLDQFKAWLVDQNRRQNVQLARADLVDAMDPTQVERSEIDDLGAQFHFLVDKDARESWELSAPHASDVRTSTRPQPRGGDMPKKNQMERDIDVVRRGDRSVSAVASAGDARLYYPGGSGGGGQRRGRGRAGAVVLPHERTSPSCTLCPKYHTTEEHLRHMRGRPPRATPSRGRKAMPKKKTKTTTRRPPKAQKSRRTPKKARKARKTKSTRGKRKPSKRASTSAPPREAHPTRRSVGLEEFRGSMARVPLQGPAGPPARRRVGLPEFRDSMARVPVTPVTPSAPSDADVARLVLDAARDMPPSGRYGWKVFISEIWDRTRGETGMSFEQFRRWLLDANRRGVLTLARADLVGAMDGARVARSEISDRGASFHFVLDPSHTPG